jgi:hypothetical protein
MASISVKIVPERRGLPAKLEAMRPKANYRGSARGFMDGGRGGSLESKMRRK